MTDPAGRQSSPLTAPTACDVCVVGGGIAGLTAAYLLADAGKRVVLLEAQSEVGAGETAFTTAHLAWVLDDRFSRLKKARGADVAKAAADSHRSAVDLIQQIAAAERIDCDFKRVDGYLFPGDPSKETASLREEQEAVQELHLPHEWRTEVRNGGLWQGECLRFPDQGQFHPLKYLSGLAAAVRRKGGVIHTGTRVERIDGGDPCTVATANGGTVTANQVVVATGSPFDAGAVLHTKLAAYITYAVGVEVPAGAVPHALYWDTEDPYHYVRVQPGEGSDLLIVGGEDHKTGQEHDQTERWGRLIGWVRQRVPAAGEVSHRWSGQVFETPDGLGLIGRAPWGKNLFVITGDSGMGMTHGTLGGRLVANLILGQADPLAGVYDPNRWMPGALLTLLGEAANMAAQYADWVTGGDVKSVDQIPPGQGAVVRVGLTKHAVYRDKGGRVVELSAVCPHMGGLVRWNPGEQTWDCPCHGSRFTCKGEVLHGPAKEGLKKVGG